MACFLIKEYRLIEEDYLAERKKLLNLVNFGDKEQSNKADIELSYLDGKTSWKLLELHETIRTKVQPSRFLFNERIYVNLTSLVNELFSYILIEHNSLMRETKRDDRALKEKIKSMNDEKIIEQMEECLNIAKISIDK